MVQLSLMLKQKSQYTAMILNDLDIVMTLVLCCRNGQHVYRGAHQESRISGNFKATGEDRLDVYKRLLFLLLQIKRS